MNHWSGVNEAKSDQDDFSEKSGTPPSWSDIEQPTEKEQPLINPDHGVLSTTFMKYYSHADAVPLFRSPKCSYSSVRLCTIVDIDFSKIVDSLRNQRIRSEINCSSATNELIHDTGKPYTNLEWAMQQSRKLNEDSDDWIARIGAVCCFALGLVVIYRICPSIPVYSPTNRFLYLNRETIHASLVYAAVVCERRSVRNADGWKRKRVSRLVGWNWVHGVHFSRGSGDL